MANQIIIEYTDNKKKPARLTLIDSSGNKLLQASVALPLSKPELEGKSLNLTASPIFLNEKQIKASEDSKAGALLSRQPGRIFSQFGSLFCAAIEDGEKGLNGDKDYITMKKEDFKILFAAIQDDGEATIKMNKKSFILDLNKVKPNAYSLNTMISDVLVNHMPRDPQWHEKSINELMSEKAPHLSSIFNPISLVNFYMATNGREMNKEFIKNKIHDLDGFKDIEYTNLIYKEDGYKLELYDDEPKVLATMTYKNGKYELIGNPEGHVVLEEQAKKLVGKFFEDDKTALSFEVSQSPQGIKINWVPEYANTTNNNTTTFSPKGYQPGTMARQVSTYQSGLSKVKTEGDNIREQQKLVGENPYLQAVNKQSTDSNNVQTGIVTNSILPEMVGTTLINGIDPLSGSSSPSVLPNGQPILYGNPTHMRHVAEEEKRRDEQYKNDGPSW